MRRERPQGRPYPVPARKPWRVMVEFRDGSKLTGLTDAEVVETWFRIASYAAVCHDRDSFRQALASRVGVSDDRFHRARPVRSGASDTELLDALAYAGEIEVIRK